MGTTVVSHRSHTSAVGTVALLAHQGGWDEILLVVGPIVAIIGLLTLVKRRIDRGSVD